MSGRPYTAGGTSADGRERVIRTFQSFAADAPDVIFVSLKAGGVGINLTAASRVYMLDPWWNPAVEEQAGTDPSMIYSNHNTTRTYVRST